MPIVRMPNGDLVRFPDNMPDSEIGEFIYSKFPEIDDRPKQEAPKAAPRAASKAPQVGASSFNEGLFADPLSIDTGVAPPRQSVMEGVAQEGAAMPMVRPEVRQQVMQQYNQATSQQRQQMAAQPTFAGGLISSRMAQDQSLDAKLSTIAEDLTINSPLNRTLNPKTRTTEFIQPDLNPINITKPSPLATDTRIEAEKSRLLDQGPINTDTLNVLANQVASGQRTGVDFAQNPNDESVLESIVRNQKDFGISLAGVGVANTAKTLVDVGRLVTGDAEPLRQISEGIGDFAKTLSGYRSTQFQLDSIEFERQLKDGFNADGILNFFTENPAFFLSKASESVATMFPVIKGAQLAQNSARALEAVKLLPKAQQAAVLASVGQGSATTVGALLNAADAFDSTKGTLGDKYQAAGVAGLFSLVGGALTKGGAEGAIVSGGSSKTLGQAALNTLKAAGRENAQEFLEEGGAELGKQIGEGKGIDAGQIFNQGLVGAALSTPMGLASGASTELASLVRPEQADGSSIDLNKFDRVDTSPLKTSTDAVENAALPAGTGIVSSVASPGTGQTEKVQSDVNEASTVQPNLNTSTQTVSPALQNVLNSDLYRKTESGQVEGTAQTDAVTQVQTEQATQVDDLNVAERSVFNDPDPVVTSQDSQVKSSSLLERLSQLGGLSRDEATSAFGIDPAEYSKLGTGISRVFTTQGMTLDSAVETLAEEGYLTLDANGKADVAELEQKIDLELRGKKQYGSLAAPVQTNTPDESFYSVSMDDSVEAQTIRTALGQMSRKTGSQAFDPSTVVFRPVKTGGLSMLAKALGVKVVEVDTVDNQGNFSDGNSLFNGFYKNGTVYMNRQGRNPELSVFGHEFFHNLEKNAPVLADKFKSTLGVYRQSKAWGQYREVLLSRGYTEQQLSSENAADFFGLAVSDPKFLRGLAKKEPGIFKSVVSSLRTLIAKVKSFVNPQQNELQGLLTNYEAVLDSAIEIAREYGIAVRDGTTDQFREALPDPDVPFSLEEGRPDAVSEVRAQSDATQNAPIFSRDEMVAGLGSRLIELPEKGNALKELEFSLPGNRDGDRKIYENSVDLALNESTPTSKPLPVMRDNPVLNTLGMAFKVVATNAQNIRKKMYFDHQMTRDEIVQLFDGIYKPAMVFESDTQKDGSMILVTGALKNNDPIIAVISPVANFGNMEVRLLKTAFGKSRVEQIDRWYRAGLLRYFDNKKALDPAFTVRVQFPWVTQLAKGLPDNVIGPKDVVNRDGTKFDPDVPEISFSLGDQKNLIAMNNLEASDIKFADKLGGLSVPSIGIANRSSAYEAFGSISLIGTMALADPKNNNLVFGGDAYTPRFPKPVYKTAKRAELNKVLNDIDAIRKTFGRDSRLDGLGYNLYNYPDGREFKDSLTRSVSIKAQFLKNEGQEVEPILKRPETDNIVVKRLVDSGFLDSELDIDALAKDEKFQADVIAGMIRQSMMNSNPRLSRAEATKNVEEITSDPEILEAIAGDYAKKLQAAKRQQEAGAQVDEYASADKFKSQIESMPDGQDKFDRFVQTFVDRAFPQAFIKGKGGKTVPLTLDNAVAAMKGKARGGEETMSYSTGNAKAEMIEQFKSIAQIQNNRSRIVSEEEFERVRVEIGKNVDAYLNAIRPFYKYSDIFAASDDAMKALAGLGKGAVTKDRAQSELARLDFVNPSPESVRMMMDAAQQLKSAPVEYFESKPQRSVSLSEFKGAVIPADTDGETRRVLLDKGIRIYEYERGQRRKAIDDAVTDLEKDGDEIAFSLPQTETPQFKRWFGDSKVVDAEGKPLVVYHGTSADFNIFEATNGELGRGIYFSPSSDTAAMFAARAKGEAQSVMPVYLSMQNPLVTKDREMARASGPTKLKKKGYDGVIFTSATGDVQYVVFESAQIKSATGNNGQFDSANPDIRFSLPDTVIVDGESKPTRNSDGKLLANDVESIENFWRWFDGRDRAQGQGNNGQQQDPERVAGRAGNDANGRDRLGNRGRPIDEKDRPVTLYHGTKDDFSTFKVGSANSKDFGWLGKGIYLTDSRDLAETYARLKRGDAGENVMPVYASITNPYIASSDFKRKMKAAGSAESERFTQYLRDNGFDSVMLEFEDGDREYMVLDSKQVKSATGNNGQFDPENPDIRFSLPIQNSDRTPIVVPNQTAIDRTQFNFEDLGARQEQLERIVQEAAGQRMMNGRKVSPYNKREIYPGVRAELRVDFITKEVDPFMAAVKKAAVSLDRLMTYRYALHAEERNIQIAKIDPLIPDGGSGMPTQVARDLLAGKSAKWKGRDGIEREIPAFGAGEIKRMDALQPEIDKLIDGTRDLLVSTGLEDKDTVDIVRGKYKYWIPLAGTEDTAEDSMMKGVSPGFSVFGSTIKRALGRETLATDIFGQLIQMREQAIDRAQKNEVGLEALNYFLELQKDGYDLLGMDGKPLVQINPVDTVRYFKKGTVEDFRMEASIKLGVMPDTLKEAQILDYVNQQYFGGNAVKKTLVTFMQNQKGRVNTRDFPAEMQDNTSAVRVGGNDVLIRWNDQGLAEAYRNIGVDQLGDVMGYVKPITNYYRNIYTGWNPFFWATNLIRDLGSTPFASVQEGYGMPLKVITSLPTAFKEAFKGIYRDGSPLWDEYRMSGSRTGFVTSYKNAEDRQAVLLKEFDKINSGKKSLLIGKAILEYTLAINNLFEDGVRMSAFLAGKKDGMSTEEAATMVRRVAPNFNRKGKYSDKLSASYVFFNAAVQGSRVLRRTLMSKEGQVLSGAVITASTVLNMMTALMMGEDDDGEPLWNSEQVRKDRTNNILIPTGNEERPYIKIPLAYGLNFIWNIGAAVPGIYLAKDKIKQIGIESLALAAAFADGFMPPPVGATVKSGSVVIGFTPTFAQLPVQLAVNKNGFGQQIVPDMAGNVPNNQKMLKSTRGTLFDDAAQGLNKLTGGTPNTEGFISASPEQLKAVMSNLFGTFYTTALLVGSENRVGRETGFLDAPLMRNFSANPDLLEGDDVRKFYERQREIEALSKDINFYTDQRDLEKVKSVRSENPQLILAERAGELKQELGDITKEIINVRNSKDKTDAEKALIIRQKDKIRQQKVDSFNRKYNELTGIIEKQEAN